MDVSIKIEKKEKGLYIVSLSGSLDSVTYVECEEKIAKILAPSAKAIIFNMEGLEYISSIGFTVIFGKKRELERHGGTIAIAGLKENVKRVFDTMKVFPELIFENIEDAKKYTDDFIGKK